MPLESVVCLVPAPHGDLWVAGVVASDLTMADTYACFVDPDESPFETV